jgi:hypothetical protein
MPNSAIILLGSETEKQTTYNLGTTVLTFILLGFLHLHYMRHGLPHQNY